MRVAILCVCMMSAGAALGGGLHLVNGSIDTSGGPQVPRGAAQKMTARRMQPVLVQCADKITEEWKRALEAAGARIHGYVPENGVIVEAAPGSLSALAGVPGTRWLGEYKPAYKISPAVRGALERAERLARVRRELRAAPPDGVPEALHERWEQYLAQVQAETTTVEVLITLFSGEDCDAVVNEMQRGGARAVTAQAGGRGGYVRAIMETEGVTALAEQAAVRWIDVAPKYRVWNNVAVQAPRLNVEAAWNTNWPGLSGANQIVGHADTGLDTGNQSTLHPDFTNRVHAVFARGRTSDWSDPNGHGTHTAGSLMGNGSAYSNGLFKGVAYEARIVHQSLLDQYGNILLPMDLRELFSQAYGAGARIHSDSWGFDGTVWYHANSMQCDDYVWNNPAMTLVFAIGNSGNDRDADGRITSPYPGIPGNAKNVITVGASESARAPGEGGYSADTYGRPEWVTWFPVTPIANDYVSSSADGVHQGMFANSTRGPALDGRIKPDVVAPGTDIVSCRSQAPGATAGWGVYPGNSNYIFAGGTSMATPLVAGCAALVRQYLQERHTPAIANPSAALIKAILINGARSLSPGQYGYDEFREIPAARPNMVEGWGQVNLADSLTNLTVYHGYSLKTGETNTFGIVLTATNDLVVTLVWSDYPGVEFAATALVNDLDMTLTTPAAEVVYPNGGAGRDAVNNVEGIELRHVAPGAYTITIAGYNVPMGTSQPYALVIRGAQPRAPQFGIERISHAPQAVQTATAPVVTVLVNSNASGIGAVQLQYAVNSGAWADVGMAWASGIDGGGAYTAAVPAQALGAVVEYCASAQAGDAAWSFSVTNMYDVQTCEVRVALEGTQTPPYDTWVNAFSNLYDALAFVSDGWSVLVSNGVYSGGRYVDSYGVTQRVEQLVNKDILMRGVNGADATVIDAGLASRCLTIAGRAAVVEGFTLRNGYMSSGDGVAGGGAYMLHGTLRGCIVENNYLYALGTEGGGVMLEGDGLVDGCVIRRNQSSYGWSNNGGGVAIRYRGVIRSSVIYNNTASSSFGSLGGGVALSLGGVVSNCTIAYNSATEGGGVDMWCTGIVNNSIVYYNTGGNYANRNDGSSEAPQYVWTWNCTTPLPSGGNVTAAGNISAEPQLAWPPTGDFRLQNSSPCRDAGSNDAWMASAQDAAGAARIANAIVDMGAYEFGPLAVSFSADKQYGLSPLTIVFSNYVSGFDTNIAGYAWDFEADGAADSAEATPTHIYYETDHFYSVALVVSNTSGETAAWQLNNYIYAYDTNIHYVARDGGHVWPYTSWGRAATNVNDALTALAGLSGHSIVISDGVHRLRGTVSVSIPATVRGLHGADATVLDGGGSVRCAALGNTSALLEGLTLSNGYTTAGGGGLYLSGGAARDVRITCNTAEEIGGGVYITGANANNQIVERAEITHNTSEGGGGGIGFYNRGTVRNCRIMDNSAPGGGGVFLTYDIGQVIMRSCLIANNVATLYDAAGGGVYVDYRAALTMENCTIASNYAAGYAGGLYLDTSYAVQGTRRNNIIYHNSAARGNQNWRGAASHSYSCSTPALSGTANITLAPQFTQWTTGDFHLQTNSPCITAGQFQSWMNSARELDGLARVWGRGVEMGAYEFAPAGAWLSVSATALVFGTVIIDTASTQSFTAYNEGQSTLAGSAAGLAAPFTLAAGSPYSIGGGAVQAISVRFAPTEEGTFTQTLMLTGANPVRVEVSGTAVPEAIGPIGLIGLMLLMRTARRRVCA